MRVLTVVLGLAACLSLGLVSGTAQANSVGIEQVRQMAFDHGIVRLDEIELRRRKGVWQVEGEDANGNDIEMDVDARTGRIIRMERD
ncbi:MAG: PepSY domain-containing protein [Methyloceanibacter sp.]|uniref:PepSY domain-containing protein n=1 Tax=Methyloceanibacter sp. TaxID=1965321 RepID=UPI001D642698|nr:PepSY domain-containing protein [Methyloceanibacter sp.]MCB1441925.1 PepSY domain-containing protein [Methyloceanibacter sp.]MCC0058438.1 PepSY domain-containing protein [Hyphomicrobiaceae bacterium]